MATIDLNADLGEGCGNDEALLEIVSSCNIACGGHTGDVESMRATILAAKRHGVAIGAHPSFPDRANFGRVAMQRTPEEIYEDVHGQVSALWLVADECDAQLRHVKPHGALYNIAAKDHKVAHAVTRAVHDIDPKLLIYGLAGGALHGVREGFADRRYEPDGTLVPRSQPHAMIETVDEAVQQSLVLAHKGAFDSICLHGDGEHAVEFARAIRSALEKAGVMIRAVGLVAVLALLFVTPLHALASARPQAQAVLATEARWLKASVEGDAKTLGTILAENWVHINYQGKLLYREDALAAMKKPLPYKQALSEQTVDFAGNIAIVRGVNTVTDKTGAVVLRLRYADVYVFENKKWMAISAQETVMKP